MTSDQPLFHQVGLQLNTTTVGYMYRITYLILSKSIFVSLFYSFYRCKKSVYNVPHPAKTAARIEALFGAEIPGAKATLS